MTKLLQYLSALLISAILISADKNGKCDNSDDCKGMECVSVLNSIAGLEEANQCVAEPVCSGLNIGKCPTFSSWPSSYLKLQPICAFLEPPNCSDESSSEDDDDLVDCYNKTITYNNQTTYKFGIYACMAKGRYEAQNGGHFPELTEEQLEACKGSEDNDFATCNNQGTCKPTGRDESTYKCHCNAGYEQTDNCFKRVNNGCDSYGACNLGGRCDMEKRECVCDEGFGGFQCGECTSNVGCMGNGQCAKGKCVCDDGWKGVFCEKGAGGGSSSAASLQASALVISTGILALALQLVVAIA